MLSVRHPSWIHAASPADAFPPVDCALDEPNGLLAIGGDLTAQRLLHAYRMGIFPWYSEGQPILWWSPDPRAVLFPAEIRVSRSLRKRLARKEYGITSDASFEAVIESCAAPRVTQSDTWITNEMMDAYIGLHELGHAHSLECWVGDRLVGGLYGIQIGCVFFGESMFSRAPDASKVALVRLCRSGYALIDCQLPNKHLASLGAVDVSRSAFVSLLDRWCVLPGPTAASSVASDLA